MTPLKELGIEHKGRKGGKNLCLFWSAILVISKTDHNESIVYFRQRSSPPLLAHFEFTQNNSPTSKQVIFFSLHKTSFQIQNKDPNTKIYFKSSFMLKLTALIPEGSEDFSVIQPSMRYYHECITGFTSLWDKNYKSFLKREDMNKNHV